MVNTDDLQSDTMRQQAMQSQLLYMLDEHHCNAARNVKEIKKQQRQTHPIPKPTPFGLCCLSKCQATGNQTSSTPTPPNTLHLNH